MQFPNNIGFAVAEPHSESPAYISESHSLKTISASTGAQRFGFTLTTGMLRDPELRRAWAFLNALGGQATKFDVLLPMFSQPLGVVSGLVQAPTNYGIGSDNMSFTNYLPEIGDFIKPAGHNKVYQIQDTSGSSATIYPPLISPVSLAEVINVTDVKFTVRLDSPISKLKLDTQRTTKLKFKVIEAF
jgi:hypothetical protein